jgi:general secretion pathway protein D
MRPVPLRHLRYLLTILALSACHSAPPVIEPSQGHLRQTEAPAAAPPIPPTVATAPYVPPPQTGEKTPRYTIVVHDVAVKDLLFTLARDTKVNIDIHPGIVGRASINAVNEPLPAILERVARQADIRYRLEGNTLSVMPDSPYLKTYPVGYVNIARSTTSSIGVAAQIAATGGGAVGTSGGGASGGNNSSTTVTTTSNNNFWEVLTDNLRSILASTRAVTQGMEARAAAEHAASEARVAQAQAVSGAGQAAPALFNTAFAQSAPKLEAKDEVIVNPVAGTVTVLATERQHGQVSDYLGQVISASQRQVLIEATIVEVTLKDQFKAGVDWTKVVEAGEGLAIATATATNLANQITTPFATLTYSDAEHGLTAAVSLLESFGETRVLSSPKMMALNNQTALLKVVDNLVYFEIKADTSTSTVGSTLTTFTTTPKSVAVGLVLSVTPQVNNNGSITLTVRPTISRKIADVEDPNPSLKSSNLVNPLDISNKVPVIQVREMESVLRIDSGNTVILGGLMQDDSNRARDGLPVLSRPEGWGALFGQHERLTSQTELVIFLRPTLVAEAGLNADPLAAYRRYLPK